MERAYSLLTVKALDEDSRTITGIATTPKTDRAGDIVEPEGAEFTLPIPLLWQHRSSEPIGHVIKAKVTAAGIEIVARLAKTDEPGELKNQLDKAWQAIKLKLVRGLSIGFQAIEAVDIKGSMWAQRFVKWEWLELSAVTIPANIDATIQTVKSYDEGRPVATGKAAPSNHSPGASGRPVLITKHNHKGGAMPPFSASEKIKDLEGTRQAKAARMTAIQETAGNAGRTKDAAEQEEFDTLLSDLKGIDRELKDLDDMQAMIGVSRPVSSEPSAEKAGESRARETIIRTNPRRDKGIGFARLVKAMGIARRYNQDVEKVARRMWPDDHGVHKAAVSAGGTASGNWAEDLTGHEGGIVADFVEFLRPMTILGKFGTNGIPDLRRVGFRLPLVGQNQSGGGGDAYWVGEGKAKPLTAFDFTRTVLEPLKVANIAVLTQESINSSSPSSEGIVRDQLAAALAARLDIDFIDPDNSGDSGVAPASITDTIVAIPSSGADAEGVRSDIGALFDAFIAANNPPSSGVFVMSSRRAMRLGLMRTDIGGVREFPDISMNGGRLEGLPVIVSEYVPLVDYADIVVLLNASDIYLGDEGGVQVDMSTEASLEMLDGSSGGAGKPVGNSLTGAGASLVSMFQTNSVAFRAERTISWKRRRESSVQMLSGVTWGEAES